MYLCVGSQMFTVLDAYIWKCLNENLFKHVKDSALSVRNKLLKKF